VFPIRDTVPVRNAPVATWWLIVANSLVFLVELMLPPEALERFVYLFGLVPARFTHPEWAAGLGFPVDDYWPFLTSMFLHAGWLHVFSNMWTLWIFGDNVEDRMGAARFLIFYVLCGLAAGAVHWLTNPDSTLPTVGASGAVSGVTGAYFLLFPHSRVILLVPIFFLPFFFELPAVAYLAFWALSQVFSGALSLIGPREVGGIAWWAHVGGFVSGLALHPLFLRRGAAVRRLQPDEYGMDAAWLPSPSRRGRP
jgi:membrane associated rhomboid family serine protease